jgi:penicillin-binding protein 2
MIIEKNKYRFKFIFLIITIIIAAFLFRLAQLQIVEGEKYSEIAENKMLRHIISPAERGKIYTNEGYTLATNRIGYSVEMLYTQMDEDKRNEMILMLTKILDKHQEEYEDEFPILFQEDESLVFTFEIEEQEWKNSHDIPLDATANETIDILRERYYVKSDVSNELAIEAITKVHLNENIPISLEPSPMFSYEKQEEDWKKWYGFKEEEYNLTAQESFDKIRENNKIGNHYTIEEARKILLIREKIKSQGFRSWEAIELVEDIKKETMAEIIAQLNEMPGVAVNPKPIRNYPEGKLASHILGYISKVNEADVSEGGYKMRDLKGAQGLEGSFESQLRGTDGESLVITDYRGRPKDNFSQQGNIPIPGNNIFLTIDYDLQKASEKTLKDTIKSLQQGSNGRKAPNAESGAVVAIDVNTGGILALASYPSYDPNLFSKGISTEDWKELNILTNDPLYPRPLYNNATMAALPPGSTFKMVTGVGALEENKISIKGNVYDRGYYPGYGGNKFRCWLRSGHGNRNITTAIRDSCNVYFYEVGNRQGIDTIEKYARNLGLGSRTGIEISESQGILASKATKAKGWMYTTSNYIRNTIGIIGNSTIINENGDEQEVYTSYAIAKEIFDAVGNLEKPSSDEIYSIVAEKLQNNNIRDSQQIFQIYQYVSEGMWTPADTLNTSIGQGGNSLTPIQMANYVATLVNGGKNYKTHLVQKITSPNGEIIEEIEPVIMNEIDIDPKNLEAIKNGMKMVTMPGGTGARDFNGFPHQEIGVGAKTGSAQYGSEDTDSMAWFVSFAPYENPQIAIAAMIVEGSSGGYAGTIVRDVLDNYFGLEEETETNQRKSINNNLNE